MKNQKEQEFHREMIIDAKFIINCAGLKAILAGSALLGFIRGGDLVPWCKGAVLLVHSEEITEEITEEIINEFEKQDFKIVKRFVKPENYKIRIQKDKFNVEITGYIRGKDYYYRKLKKKKKIIPHKFLDKLDEMKFFDSWFDVPYNPEEFLSFIYKDWKVPDRSNSPSIYKSKEHMVIIK